MVQFLRLRTKLHKRRHWHLHWYWVCIETVDIGSWIQAQTWSKSDPWAGHSGKSKVEKEWHFPQKWTWYQLLLTSISQPLINAFISVRITKMVNAFAAVWIFYLFIFLNWLADQESSDVDLQLYAAEWRQLNMWDGPGCFSLVSKQLKLIRSTC